MRLAVLLLAFCLSAFAAGTKPLDIYIVDAEGGKAMLVVSPSGQSMLVDVGFPGQNGRDVDRIVAAARAAGVDAIDYLLITHYDLDHMGDVPLLLSKIPVRHILDNGEVRSTGKGVEQRYKVYAEARDKLPHSVLKVGDRLPLRGVDIEVVTAATEHIRAAAGKATPNRACEASEVRKPIVEDLEDNMSIGLLYRFGKFRMIDLADAEWDLERSMMCPENPIGPVDVYVTSVHGQSKAGSPALVHGLAPRVAIMNNGVRKGGAPEIWDIMRNSPGLEDIWQSHMSQPGGKEHNSPEDLVANLEQACEAKTLRISVASDGTYTVTNNRNGFSKTYKPR